VKKDPLFLSRPGHAGDATGTAERVTATDWLVVARRPKD
jgi:hypothetical protein